MRNNIFVLLLFASCVFGACTSEHGNRHEYKEADVTLNGISATNWTYFRFETGEVVGQSTFGSSAEDSLWASRRDWDFAIAGDYLKTNSGTSGEGLGGVQRITSGDYSSLTQAPASGYIVDTLGVIR